MTGSIIAGDGHCHAVNAKFALSRKSAARMASSAWLQPLKSSIEPVAGPPSKASMLALWSSSTLNFHLFCRAHSSGPTD